MGAVEMLLEVVMASALTGPNKVPSREPRTAAGVPRTAKRTARKVLPCAIPSYPARAKHAAAMVE